jgi:hypothetical protein
MNDDIVKNRLRPKYKKRYLIFVQKRLHAYIKMYDNTFYTIAYNEAQRVRRRIYSKFFKIEELTDDI